MQASAAFGERTVTLHCLWGLHSQHKECVLLYVLRPRNRDRKRERDMQRINYTESLWLPERLEKYAQNCIIRRFRIAAMASGIMRNKI